MVLGTRCTSGRGSRVMGPRSPALRSTVGGTDRGWGQTLWEQRHSFSAVYTPGISKQPFRDISYKPRLLEGLCVFRPKSITPRGL